uniref:Bm238 n=1 Tax=Brugia malayi TaxID=6279 RepID=A0A0H5S3P2_BRUMA|nr:Bm238 [Brugia malayi]
MDGKNEMGEWKRTTEQKFSQPDANMVWKWVDRLYMFKEGGVEVGGF